MTPQTLDRSGMWSRNRPAEEVRILTGAEMVLDIGCGPGRHLIFPVSVGLDNDLRAVARARRKAPVVLGDAHYLPFRGGVFDISLLWGILNYLEDPNQAYREADRVASQDPVYSLVNYAKSARWIITERVAHWMNERRLLSHE